MDNESIRKLLHLNDDEFNRMVEYQRKAENAHILYCEDHDIEWFDFEAGCWACEQASEEDKLDGGI